MNAVSQRLRMVRVALMVSVLLTALLATAAPAGAVAGVSPLAGSVFSTGITGATYDCAFPKGDTATGMSRWLSGQIDSSGTIATVYNWSDNCTIKVGLASYKVFDFNTNSVGELVLDENGNPIPRVSTQELFDASTITIGPGQRLTLNVTVPDCMSQVDLFYGDVIVSFATGDRYTSRLLHAKNIGSELCSRDGSCTLTPGYWKTHAEAWPVASLQIGNNVYGDAELMAMLWKPTQGNGLTSLTRHLIAAKLNVAIGTNPSAVSDAIAQADAMIGGLVPPPVGNDSLKTGAVSSLVSILDNYNNGLIGPGHCK